MPNMKNKFALRETHRKVEQTIQQMIKTYIQHIGFVNRTKLATPFPSSLECNTSNSVDLKNISKCIIKPTVYSPML